MEGSSLQIQKELLLAKQSRLEGNEGRARVCARRAAGAAAQSYLIEAGYPQKNKNVLQSLTQLRELNSTPDHVRNAVNWLLKRVDEDNTIPQRVDLISEAKVIRP